MKSTLLLPLIAVFASFYSIAQITPTFDDIMIEMRDGEFLEVDVYVPSGPGPYECILIQTPYNKDSFLALPLGLGTNIDAQPYAWVIADWRGFYGSNGAASNGGERGQDGYDLCEWIIQQTWHGDKIGTWGPSALGKVQYDTAFEQHPNHTCAVPLVAHPQFSYQDYFYGGVLEESRLQQLDALGYGLSPIVLANVYYSATWTFAENQSWTPQLLTIPTLQIGGWYDHNIQKQLEWYTATRSSVPVSVQDEQWLLVGPWVHGGTGIAYVGSSIQGELTYPNAAGVNNDMALDFFAYYLLNDANGWETTPAITYYEMGVDQWTSTSAASLNVAQSNILYLDQNNTLRSSTGVGSTSFTCDPNNPSPTIGGPTLATGLDQGPYDQVSLLSRNDVVAFSTPTLTQNAHVTGQVQARIYFESNQADGDIVIRLVDEYPDGRNMLINDGTRRMRFRNGYTTSDEAFVSPGTVYSMEITMPFTDYTWLSGHKIKVLVSGNSDNRWDVNLQDGGTMYQPGTGNVANITIHHSAASGSYITLPGNNDFLSVNSESEENFEMYPNPANDVLHLACSAVEFKVEIRSLSGQLVAEFENKHDIDIRALEQGSYILEMHTDYGRKSRKFIKL